MPDPVLRLDLVRLRVEPGREVRVVVTIANTGSIVEGFRVDVVGGAAPWAEVLTPEISVFPRRDATVVVAFSPPSGSKAPIGIIAFGVRVVSLVDRRFSAVAEGDIEVAQVFGLQATITPVNSAGRWSGKHRIELTNGGNSPLRVRFVPTDPDQKLDFLLSPGTLDLPVGGIATALLKVRTRTPTLRGAAARLPFRIMIDPDPPPPTSGLPAGAPDLRRPILDAAFNQRPIIARSVVPASAVALVALAAGGATLIHHQHFGVPVAPASVSATAPTGSTVPTTPALPDGPTSTAVASATAASATPSATPSAAVVTSAAPSSAEPSVSAPTPGTSTTAASGGSASTGPSCTDPAATSDPTFPAGYYLAIVRSWTESDTTSCADVESQLAQASAAAATYSPQPTDSSAPTPPQVGSLLSQFYPGLSPSPTASAEVVYVGPFSSADDATAYCTAEPAECAASGGGASTGTSSYDIVAVLPSPGTLQSPPPSSVGPAPAPPAA